VAELAILAFVVVAVLVFLVWASRQGSKVGAGKVIADSQAQVIKDIQERNEIDRTTPVDGAADRLRNSRWNRDREPLPDRPTTDDRE